MRVVENRRRNMVVVERLVDGRMLDDLELHFDELAELVELLGSVRVQGREVRSIVARNQGRR